MPAGPRGGPATALPSCITEKSERSPAGNAGGIGTVVGGGHRRGSQAVRKAPDSDRDLDTSSGPGDRCRRRAHRDDGRPGIQVVRGALHRPAQDAGMRRPARGRGAPGCGQFPRFLALGACPRFAIPRGQAQRTVIPGTSSNPASGCACTWSRWSSDGSRLSDFAAIDSAASRWKHPRPLLTNPTRMTTCETMTCGAASTAGATGKAVPMKLRCPRPAAGPVSSSRASTAFAPAPATKRTRTMSRSTYRHPPRTASTLKACECKSRRIPRRGGISRDGPAKYPAPNQDKRS